MVSVDHGGFLEYVECFHFSSKSQSIVSIFGRYSMGVGYHDARDIASQIASARSELIDPYAP